MEAGTLALEEPGRTSPVWGPSGDPVRLTIALLSATLCAAIASPEIVRLTRGWPTNPNMFPPVAGPGDEFRYYFPEHITSVKGLWRGVGHAELTSGSTTERLQASTAGNSWGQSIYVERGYRETHPVWLDVRLPARSRGPVAQLRLHLSVEYPSAVGTSSFRVVTATRSASPMLQLGSPGGGTLYSRLFFAGTIAGLVLTLLLGLGVQFQLYRSGYRDEGTVVDDPAEFRESPRV